MAAECVFCRIAQGRAPAAIVLERPDVVAFRDIAPKAPVHVLVVPRRHVRSIADVGAGDAALLAALVDAANTVAREAGIAESGYRLVVNQGRDGGQAVDHVHVHVLGGKPLTWFR